MVRLLARAQQPNKIFDFVEMQRSAAQTLGA